MAETQTETAKKAKPGFDRVRVRVLPDGRMNRKDAAKYLGRVAKTLATWHLEGRGPRSVLIGRRRFYYLADLDAFIAIESRRSEMAKAVPGGQPPA